jgi:predicted RNase H-like HicB family nuclease
VNEILISLQIEELPEGVFLATSQDLPGLLAEGRTIAEAMEIAQDVARKLVESYIEHGDELPAALRGATPERIDVKIPVNVA